MGRRFNGTSLAAFVGGSVAWALILGAASLGLERLGVRPFWALFPASALIASLVTYGLRIPNIYQGSLDRENRHGVWFGQQVATWGVLALVMWFFRSYMK